MALTFHRLGKMSVALFIFAGAVAMSLFIFGCVAPVQPTENVTPVPKPCPSLYSPVCGADNTTYNNSCLAQRAGANISYTGECKVYVPSCKDSDTGKKIFSAGKTSMDSVEKTDACLNSTHVQEFYCMNNTMQNESVACPEEYTCRQGECVIKVTPITCIDSDNGTDFYTSGSVMYGGKNYSDGCVLVNQVREYYCSNGEVKVTSYVCKLGFQCVAGRCVEMPSVCTDTDGGKFEAINGTVTVAKGYDLVSMGADYCINSSYVDEYFCSNGSMSRQGIYCGENSSCMDNACFHTECYDSDGGQNVMQKGQTGRGNDFLTDNCSGAYNVMEFFCQDDEVKNTTNTCPTGHICKNGECVVGSS